MQSRTQNAEVLSSKSDEYTFCPNCGSLNMIRDLRDSINDCHDCGFNHFVGLETVETALGRWDEYQTRRGK
jgi:ribosomal protein L37AE/L43A